MALTDDQKTQLADLYDEAQKTGDKSSMQRIYTALHDDAHPMTPVSGNHMQTFVEGMGREFVRLGNGLRQMNSGDAVNPETGDVLDQSGQRAQVNADVAEHARLDKPLMATTAGKLGSVATDAALMAAAPGGWAGAIGGGAALGAAEPVQGDESRGLNTVLGGAGGAVGQGVGSVLGRIIRPVGNYLVGARDTAVNVLKAAGVPLDAAQQTGSKLLITAKNAAADSPVLGASELPAKQAAAFTGAALKTMGIGGAEDASQAVMEQGKQVLKRAYDDIASRNSINVDPVMDRALYTLRAQAETSLTAENAKVIKTQIKNITDGVRTGRNPGKGTIDGDRYAAINEALDKVAGDGGKAPFVKEIRQTLTDALRRSASPEDVQLLAKTDQQYAAMKQIEKARTADEQISPHLLYNAVSAGGRGKNQVVYGSGPNQELVQLAQAGKLVFGSRTPNSGTTQRMLGATAMGSAAALADAKAHGGSVETPLVGIAGAIAGPALARAVIENPHTAAFIAAWAKSKGIKTAADAARWLASRVATGGAVQAEQPTQQPE